MGCGRCSGGGNRGLTGQRGPRRAGGIGPVLHVVDRSLAPCGGQHRPQRSGLGRPVVLESRVTASAAVARGMGAGLAARTSGQMVTAACPWHPWPWPLPVRGGPATSAAPIPALCSLHSRGRTLRAAVPSSLAGLSLGGPPSTRHPRRSCEVVTSQCGAWVVCSQTRRPRVREDHCLWASLCVENRGQEA